MSPLAVRDTSATGWLAAVAAFLTGLAGVVTAWSAVNKARHDGRGDCEERLREARAEAEAAHVELHRYRMSDPDGTP